MLIRWIAPALTALTVFSPLALAQEVGSNAYVDKYFGDWRQSAPHASHGALEERDILTRGDALKPEKKGAVLRYMNSYSYATLAPHTSTISFRRAIQRCPWA